MGQETSKQTETLPTPYDILGATQTDNDYRLQCSVKDGTFNSFKSIVPNYVAHPGDDINAIEWRLTNPADIEIISVLFIPVTKSITEAVQARTKKLGIDPNSVK
ncbi:unnamed protein product [Rotaria sp. Silwood1]|nr:unnamed protein product [Rotaria sp. Silwood1]